MFHAIEGYRLKNLDLITYELNFLIKKIRSIRNSRDMSKEEFITELKVWIKQVGENADKLEDFVEDLEKNSNNAK